MINFVQYSPAIKQSSSNKKQISMKGAYQSQVTKEVNTAVKRFIKYRNSIIGKLEFDVIYPSLKKLGIIKSMKKV